jgi:hypothetical protein
VTAPGVARRIALRLLRVGTGAMIVIILFTIAPLERVASIMGGAELFWVFCGGMFALLVQWLTALRLKILCDVHRLDVTTRQAFALNLVTRFYGLFLPGGSITAILVRVFQLASDRWKFAGAIAAVTADRLLATMAMCAIGIISWLIAWPDDQWHWLVALSAALLALLVPVVAALYWPTRAADNATSRPSRIFDKPLRAAGLAVAELRAMPIRDLLLVLGLSVSAQAVGLAEYVALAEAVELDVGVSALGWVRSAMILATLLPLSVSGLGLREGTALLALATYGTGAEAAVAFSLLVFAVTILGVGMLGGVVEAARWLHVRRQ